MLPLSVPGTRICVAVGHTRHVTRSSVKASEGIAC
jgi:hypothetical protein